MFLPHVSTPHARRVYVSKAIIVSVPDSSCTTEWLFVRVSGASVWFVCIYGEGENVKPVDMALPSASWCPPPRSFSRHHVLWRLNDYYNRGAGRQKVAGTRWCREFGPSALHVFTGWHACPGLCECIRFEVGRDQARARGQLTQGARSCRVVGSFRSTSPSMRPFRTQGDHRSRTLTRGYQSSSPLKDFCSPELKRNVSVPAFRAEAPRRDLLQRH